MRYRILFATAAAALLVGLVPSPAGAVQADQSSTSIAATITAGGIGSRTVAALPIVMSSLAGNGKVSGAYSVSVTETAVTGFTPWSVTTAVSELTSAVDSSKIAPNAFDITTPTVTGVPTAGTDTATAGSAYSGTGTQSSPLTLWTNTGQLTTSVYTSLHTATGTLNVTPPNGAKTGAYTGTFTVTLFT